MPEPTGLLSHAHKSLDLTVFDVKMLSLTSSDADVAASVPLSMSKPLKRKPLPVIGMVNGHLPSCAHELGSPYPSCVHDVKLPGFAKFAIGGREEHSKFCKLCNGIAAACPVFARATPVVSQPFVLEDATWTLHVNVNAPSSTSCSDKVSCESTSSTSCSNKVSCCESTSSTSCVCSKAPNSPKSYISVTLKRERNEVRRRGVSQYHIQIVCNRRSPAPKYPTPHAARSCDILGTTRCTFDDTTAGNRMQCGWDRFLALTELPHFLHPDLSSSNSDSSCKNDLLFFKVTIVAVTSAVAVSVFDERTLFNSVDMAGALHAFLSHSTECESTTSSSSSTSFELGVFEETCDHNTSVGPFLRAVDTFIVDRNKNLGPAFDDIVNALSFPSSKDLDFWLLHPNESGWPASRIDTQSASARDSLFDSFLVHTPLAPEAPLLFCRQHSPLDYIHDASTTTKNVTHRRGVMGSSLLIVKWFDPALQRIRFVGSIVVSNSLSIETIWCKLTAFLWPMLPHKQQSDPPTTFVDTVAGRCVHIIKEQCCDKDANLIQSGDCFIGYDTRTCRDACTTLAQIESLLQRPTGATSRLWCLTTSPRLDRRCLREMDAAVSISAQVRSLILQAEQCASLSDANKKSTGGRQKRRRGRLSNSDAASRSEAQIMRLHKKQLTNAVNTIQSIQAMLVNAHYHVYAIVQDGKMKQTLKDDNSAPDMCACCVHESSTSVISGDYYSEDDDDVDFSGSEGERYGVLTFDEEEVQTDAPTEEEQEVALDEDDSWMDEPVVVTTSDDRRDSMKHRRKQQLLLRKQELLRRERETKLKVAQQRQKPFRSVATKSSESNIIKSTDNPPEGDTSWSEPPIPANPVISTISTPNEGDILATKRQDYVPPVLRSLVKNVTVAHQMSALPVNQGLASMLRVDSDSMLKEILTKCEVAVSHSFQHLLPTAKDSRSRDIYLCRVGTFSLIGVLRTVGASYRVRPNIPHSTAVSPVKFPIRCAVKVLPMSDLVVKTNTPMELQERQWLHVLPQGSSERWRELTLDQAQTFCHLLKRKGKPLVLSSLRVNPAQRMVASSSSQGVARPSVVNQIALASISSKSTSSPALVQAPPCTVSSMVVTNTTVSTNPSVNITSSAKTSSIETACFTNKISVPVASLCTRDTQEETSYIDSTESDVSLSCDSEDGQVSQMLRPFESPTPAQAKCLDELTFSPPMPIHTLHDVFASASTATLLSASSIVADVTVQEDDDDEIIVPAPCLSQFAWRAQMQIGLS